MKLTSDFFGELDRHVSRRLLSRRVPDETELTKEVERHFHPDKVENSYTKLLGSYISNMQKAGVEVVTTTVSFSKTVERRVTASDLAIIMSYTDSLGTTRKRINLFQAKKLYLPKEVNGWTEDNPYSLNSSFSAFDVFQNKALRTLENLLGIGVCKYLYYLPPTNGFSAEDQCFIIGMQNVQSQWPFCSNTCALALRDALLDTGGNLDLGLWVSSAHHVAPRARDVFGHAFSKMLPLSWFISNSLDLCSADWFLNRAYQPEDLNFLEDLVNGSPPAIQKANESIRESLSEISAIGEFSRFAYSTIKVELSSPRYQPELTPLPSLDPDPRPTPRPGG